MYDHLHFITAPGFMFSNPSYMGSVITILICRSHPVTLLQKRVPCTLFQGEVQAAWHRTQSPPQWGSLPTCPGLNLANALAHPVL